MPDDGGSRSVASLSLFSFSSSFALELNLGLRLGLGVEQSQHQQLGRTGGEHAWVWIGVRNG